MFMAPSKIVTFFRIPILLFRPSISSRLVFSRLRGFSFITIRVQLLHTFFKHLTGKKTPMARFVAITTILTILDLDVRNTEGFLHNKQYSKTPLNEILMFPVESVT